MNRRHVPISIFGIGLVACSSPMDTTAAEAAVVGFHSALDTGNFLQIYLESSDDLKQATTQKDFMEFLSAVHRKLGKTKEAKKHGWKVNMHTSGKVVELTYQTAFEKGEAIETFVFRMQSDQAVLAGYHVSSQALIVSGRRLTPRSTPDPLRQLA